eukprot:COSAG03_NODE_3158_length_2172_cov_34.697057_1_plen_43_part_10
MCSPCKGVGSAQALDATTSTITRHGQRASSSSSILSYIKNFYF